jgi:hypothetical protein
MNANLQRQFDYLPNLDNFWDVFETSPGVFEIQKNDDHDADNEAASEVALHSFYSDLEALGYVVAKAGAGDHRCIAALKQCYNLTIESKK